MRISLGFILAQWVDPIMKTLVSSQYKVKGVLDNKYPMRTIVVEQLHIGTATVQLLNSLDNFKSGSTKSFRQARGFDLCILLSKFTNAFCQIDSVDF